MGVMNALNFNRNNVIRIRISGLFRFSFGRTWKSFKALGAGSLVETGETFGVRRIRDSVQKLRIKKVNLQSIVFIGS